MKTFAQPRGRNHADHDRSNQARSSGRTRALIAPRSGSPLFQPGDLIQTKLTLNRQRDRYEIEADQNADRIVASHASDVASLSASATAGGAAALESGIHNRPEWNHDEPVQRQAENDEEEEEVQARFETIQRKVDKESKPEEEKEDEEEDKVAQTKSEPAAAPKIGKGVERKIHTERRGGRPLDMSTRRQMESHLGVDLRRVRIHDDHTAARLSRELNAQAFTVGYDIFFNHGRHETRTRSGRHLLAHELTHVMQQRRGELRRKVMAPEAPAAAPEKPELTRTPAEPSYDQSPVKDKPAKTAPPKADQKPPATAGDQAPPDGVKVRKEQVGKELPQEEIKPAEPLPLEGKSDEVMKNFMDADPTQIAVSYSRLGTALDGKLKDEKQEVQDNTPPLTARTRGTDRPIREVAPTPKEPPAAELKKESAGPEPAPIKAEPHRDRAKPPDNRGAVDKLEQSESGGFFSWLKDNFTSLLSAIKVKDPGVNTDAGARPKIDATGQANPDRAANQSKEGKDQVEQNRREAAEAIAKHPGQKNIQPLKVKEDHAVKLDQEKQGPPIGTPPQSDLEDFAAMPLPEDVRKAANNRMAPALKTSLAKPRQQVEYAAAERETERKTTVKQAQEESDQLNAAADKEQTDQVLSARREVADQQMASIKQTSEQAAAFDTEADQEQTKAKNAVVSRIGADEKQADANLTKAEKDAAAKKREEEERAAREKAKLENDSKQESWWERATSAVKRAVKAVTSVIDKIFTALRDAVKKIIDVAKNAAIALIEKGRKWVVDRLNEFGTWLKSKVNKYLSAFPALQKKLNAFIDKAVDAATKAVNAVADKLKEGVTALANRVAGFLDKVLSKFQAGLKAVVGIAGALLTGDFKEAAKIAFLATCEILGIDPQPVINFIEKARDQIVWIFKHPAKFFNNVAAGVKKGIQQFGAHIKKHLIGGLVAWLTGALSSVPITLPEKWDARGFFSLVMQILGLTYANIRARLVKALKPQGEAIVSKMEAAVSFIKELIDRGPIVLWEKVKESLSDIKQIIIAKISEWVAVTVIKEGIMWLIGLLNPAAAILKVVKLLFDLVMWLVNNYRRIIDFITSIYDSISELAAGKIDKAANFIEAALARTVPIVISFLASLLGLSGIGKTVQKIMHTIQKPINKALDKVIGWLVKQARKIFKAGKALVKKGKKALAKIVSWWKQRTTFKSKDGQEHEVYFKGRSAKAELMVKSDQATTLNNISKAKVWSGGKLTGGEAGQIEKAAAPVPKAAARLEAENKKKKRDRKNTTKENNSIKSAQKTIAKVLSNVEVSKVGHSPKGTDDDPVLINWYKTANDYASIYQDSTEWTIAKAAGSGWKAPNGPTIHPNTSEYIKHEGDDFDKKRTGEDDAGGAKKLNAFLLKERRADNPRVLVKQKGVTLKARVEFAKKSYEIDHIRDLALGGPDKENNIWPLLTAKNQAAKKTGNQQVMYHGESTSLYSLARKGPAGVRVKVVASKRRKGTQKPEDPIEILWYKKPADYLLIDDKNVREGVTIKGVRYKPHPFYLEPLGRTWTLKSSSNRSKANAFRKKLKEAGEEARKREEKYITKGKRKIKPVPTAKVYQVDHIFDRAWGGPDTDTNIWPLSQKKNNAANAVNYQYVSYKGEIKSVIKHKDQLEGVHVKVVEERSIPESSGGHGTTRKKPAGAALLKQMKDKKES